LTNGALFFPLVLTMLGSFNNLNPRDERQQELPDTASRRG